jgi:hypothetical protein
MFLQKSLYVLAAICCLLFVVSVGANAQISFALSTDAPTDSLQPGDNNVALMKVQVITGSEGLKMDHLRFSFEFYGVPYQARSEFFRNLQLISSDGTILGWTVSFLTEYHGVYSAYFFVLGGIGFLPNSVDTFTLRADVSPQATGTVGIVLSGSGTGTTTGKYYDSAVPIVQRRVIVGSLEPLLTTRVYGWDRIAAPGSYVRNIGVEVMATALIGPSPLPVPILNFRAAMLNFNYYGGHVRPVGFEIASWAQGDEEPVVAPYQECVRVAVVKNSPMSSSNWWLGNVNYAVEQDAEPGTTVSLFCVGDINDSMSTGFDMPMVTVGPKVMWNDPTRDGRRSMADAMLIMDYATHEAKFASDTAYLEAELTGCGYISSYNVRLSLENLLGLRDRFPVQLDYNTVPSEPKPPIGLTTTVGGGGVKLSVSSNTVVQNGDIEFDIPAGATVELSPALSHGLARVVQNGNKAKLVFASGSGHLTGGQSLVTIKGVSSVSDVKISGTANENVPIVISSVTAVEEGVSSIPVEFSLGQNYPNPFNPTTAISYQLPAVSFVRLTVYDMLGREAATLVNETKAAGIYNAAFDASGLASGVYVYQLQAGSFIQTKKMVLMK